MLFIMVLLFIVFLFSCFLVFQSLKLCEMNEKVKLLISKISSSKNIKISKWKKNQFPKPLEKQIPIEKSQECFKIILQHFEIFFEITGKSSPTWRWLMRVMFPSATPPPLALFLLLPTISRNSSVYSWNVSNELKQNEKKVTEKSMLNPSC